MAKRASSVAASAVQFRVNPGMPGYASGAYQVAAASADGDVCVVEVHRAVGGGVGCAAVVADGDVRLGGEREEHFVGPAVRHCVLWQAPTARGWRSDAIGCS